MVVISVTPLRGNHLRFFPHIGYLGLTEVIVQGVVKTALQEDRRPLKASSVIVRVRCYEEAAATARRKRSIRVMYEVAQELWEKPLDVEWGAVGDMEERFRLVIPADAPGAATTTYKTFRVWWQIEAVVNHKPSASMGSRLMAKHPIPLARYQNPTPQSPPLPLHWDSSNSLAATGRGLHFSISTENPSLGPTERLELAMFMHRDDTSLQVRKIQFVIDRHLLVDPSISPEGSDEDDMVAPAPLDEVDEVLPSPPLYDDLAAGRAAHRSISSVWKRGPSANRPSPLPSPSASRTLVAGDGSSYFASRASPPPFNATAATISKGSEIMTVWSATHEDPLLDVETTIGDDLPKAKSLYRYSIGETVKTKFAKVTFQLSLKIHIRTRAHGNEVIELDPLPICMLGTSAVERALATTFIGRVLAIADAEVRLFESMPDPPVVATQPPRTTSPPALNLSKGTIGARRTSHFMLSIDPKGKSSNRPSPPPASPNSIRSESNCRSSVPLAALSTTNTEGDQNYAGVRGHSVDDMDVKESPSPSGAGMDLDSAAASTSSSSTSIIQECEPPSPGPSPTRPTHRTSHLSQSTLPPKSAPPFVPVIAAMAPSTHSRMNPLQQQQQQHSQLQEKSWYPHTRPDTNSSSIPFPLGLPTPSSPTTVSSSAAAPHESMSSAAHRHSARKNRSSAPYSISRPKSAGASSTHSQRSTCESLGSAASVSGRSLTRSSSAVSMNRYFRESSAPPVLPMHPTPTSSPNPNLLLLSPDEMPSLSLYPKPLSLSSPPLKEKTSSVREESPPIVGMSCDDDILAPVAEQTVIMTLPRHQQFDTAELSTRKLSSSSSFSTTTTTSSPSPYLGGESVMGQRPQHEDQHKANGSTVTATTTMVRTTTPASPRINFDAYAITPRRFVPSISSLDVISRSAIAPWTVMDISPSEQSSGGGKGSSHQSQGFEDGRGKSWGGSGHGGTKGRSSESQKDSTAVPKVMALYEDWSSAEDGGRKAAPEQKHSYDPHQHEQPQQHQKQHQKQHQNHHQHQNHSNQHNHQSHLHGQERLHEHHNQQQLQLPSPASLIVMPSQNQNRNSQNQNPMLQHPLKELKEQIAQQDQQQHQQHQSNHPSLTSANLARRKNSAGLAGFFSRRASKSST